MRVYIKVTELEGGRFRAETDTSSIFYTRDVTPVISAEGETRWAAGRRLDMKLQVQGHEILNKNEFCDHPRKGEPRTARGGLGGNSYSFKFCLECGAQV